MDDVDLGNRDEALVMGGLTDLFLQQKLDRLVVIAYSGSGLNGDAGRALP